MNCATLTTPIAISPKEKRWTCAAGGNRIASAGSPCANCKVRQLCLPCGLESRDIEQLDELVYTRRRIKAGEFLYQAGAPFKSLYAVRTGFFKSFVTCEDGWDQVTGFPMSGQVIGLDGINEDRYTLNVVALEDSEVCVLPYARLDEMCEASRALRVRVHRAMSHEIVRHHTVMVVIGSMRAEQRVAAFLLNLSQSLFARGYAASQFHLRMTREDIGSYLGLKLETVSRVFSRFHKDGILSVQGRFIRILKADELKGALGHGVSAFAAEKPSGPAAAPN